MKFPRRPTELVLGGHRVDIEYREVVFAGGDRLAGLFDPQAMSICVDATLSASKREEVVVHEILEGVLSALEIDMAHKDITAVAMMLHQAIKSLK